MKKAFLAAFGFLMLAGAANAQSGKSKSKSGTHTSTSNNAAMSNGSSGSNIRTPSTWTGATPDAAGGGIIGGVAQPGVGGNGNYDTSAMRNGNGSTRRSTSNNGNAYGAMNTSPRPGDKRVKVKHKSNKTKVKHTKAASGSK